jgi:hypothetical protein
VDLQSAAICICVHNKRLHGGHSTDNGVTKQAPTLLPRRSGEATHKSRSAEST